MATEDDITDLKAQIASLQRDLTDYKAEFDATQSETTKNLLLQLMSNIHPTLTKYLDILEKGKVFLRYQYRLPPLIDLAHSYHTSRCYPCACGFC